ncbi:MAG: hypothetical protein ACRD5L_06510, partial [Bryobacteraceae bacterium]
MRKQVLLLLAAGLFVAVAAYASDHWKDKDFESWDAKDVQKVLDDSPWVKHVEFASLGAAPSDIGLAPSGSSAGGDSVGGSSEGGSGATGGGGGGGGRRGGGGGSAGGFGGQAQVYYVRWWSSRTVREAFARDAELKGKSPEEAKKPLASTPSVYELVVTGQRLEEFGRAGVDELMKSSYLMPKKGKDKLSPTHVIIEKMPDGRRVAAVVYEFAKASAAGEPS